MLFVNSFTTHFTNFHTSENVRHGRTIRRQSNLLNYLISRATIPNIRFAGGARTASPSGITAAPSITPSWITGPPSGKWSGQGSSATNLTDGEEPCSSWTIACCPKPGSVIQVAPAPSFLPRDSDDIAVSMKDQVQKAVDCYNAGATVLHVHVREPDTGGLQALEMFNEMLDRLRSAVPGMILQVGGSISFAPKDEGRGGQVARRRHAPHAG